MKLQYLGDWRDAFKWDLLHYLCTEAVPSFDRLVFVPLLTPDDAVPRDGRIPPRRFPARPFIHAFVESLSREPRDLKRVDELGIASGEQRFEVVLHGHDRFVPSREQRRDYWRDFNWTHSNSLVFLDPDNGFETKSNRGDKWVFHAELAQMLDNLPVSSAVAIYQHRPRQTWNAFFAQLADRLTYAPSICAVHDHGLAFILSAQARHTYDRVRDGARRYAQGHQSVQFTELRSNT